MVNSGCFRKDELEVSDYQYLISHDTTLKFRIGDIVFLKSSPGVPLEVVDMDTIDIHCKYDEGVITVKPQMILHYEHAGLLVYKKEHIISLN